MRGATRRSRAWRGFIMPKGGGGAASLHTIDRAASPPVRLRYTCSRGHTSGAQETGAECNKHADRALDRPVQNAADTER